MKLLCSACHSEIQGFANSSKDFLQAILGIGYLEAALNLQQIILSQTITQIVFVGTAGSYSTNIDLGEIVSVHKSALLLGLKDSYIPREYQEFSSNFVDERFKGAKCLSSLEITQNELLSTQIYSIQKENYLVENMELYGVARVANANNIPWSAYLGITNYTDSKAHEDWLRYNEVLSQSMSSLSLNFQ